MLKYTRINKELITDINMHQMIESEIRGRICQVKVRYAKANNAYTNQNFNANTDEATFINDYDVNNLYGSAMCGKLPLHSCSWVEDASIIVIDFIINYNDSVYGYILEVDVKYRKEIRDNHFDLRFLCVRDTIFKIEKLLCNIEDKYKYVVHIKMLKLEHGLKLLKIDTDVTFYQSALLKPYIDLNTKLEMLRFINLHG